MCIQCVNLQTDRQACSIVCLSLRVLVADLAPARVLDGAEECAGVLTSVGRLFVVVVTVRSISKSDCGGADAVRNQLTLSSCSCNIEQKC